MMLAAPEFVVAERVELLDEIEVAAELQHRMLADRMMRGEEGSEFEACHGLLSGLYCSWVLCSKLRAGEGQGNRGKPPTKHGCRADLGDIPSPGILPPVSPSPQWTAMNRVLAHTGARYPTLQAPMGWIARSQLASAVSRAGGLGIIETSSGETEACQAEINKMKALNLPFGVNLPIRFLRDDAMLKFVCNSGVKFVTTSAGSPAKFIAPLKGAGITVYHAVPTVETAMKCVEAGVDGLVAEGAEGGGFKNPEEVSTLVLLQGIRVRTDVPMIAAGGICARRRGYPDVNAVRELHREPGTCQLQERDCRRQGNRHAGAQQEIDAVYSRAEVGTHQGDP